VKYRSRALLALNAILSSKYATAQTSSVATAAAFMPVVEQAAPWVLGLLGSTIVHAHFPPRSSSMAVSNGVISVVLGGLGGPVAAEVIRYYLWFPSGMNGVLLASFALAAAWPWVAPALWDGIRGMWTGFVTGFSKRQTDGNK
jgi:hypothetical protein